MADVLLLSNPVASVVFCLELEQEIINNKTDKVLKDKNQMDKK